MKNRPIAISALYFGQHPSDDVIAIINDALKGCTKYDEPKVVITVCDYEASGMFRKESNSELEACYIVLGKALKSAPTHSQSLGGIASKILSLQWCIYNWKGKDLQALRKAICLVMETSTSITLTNKVAIESGIDSDSLKAIQIIYDTYHVSWGI